MKEKIVEHPFVIDMRSEMTSESTYGVAQTLKDALAIAGEFWKDCDNVFNPATNDVEEMFKVGDGYTKELDLKLEADSFYLCHACGDGPYIRIERASK